MAENVNASGELDMDSIASLKQEIRDIALAKGEYGSLDAADPLDRISTLSRLATWAGRMLWLETAQVKAQARTQAAQEAIQAKVDAGELVRLTGGRIIEADKYDPAVHGERV